MPSSPNYDAPVPTGADGYLARMWSFVPSRYRKPRSWPSQAILCCPQSQENGGLILQLGASIPRVCLHSPRDFGQRTRRGA